MRPFVSRRTLLTGGLCVAGAGVVTAFATWRRRFPTMIDGRPVLRMPFPAGTVVMCQQGNLQREGHTHAADNCLHAIDFANLALDELPVVAAAPGRVGFVFDASAPGDFEAGARFGNHVTIAHEGGCYTLYAHLGEISVRPGDRVEAAQPIGVAGMTGAAGNRHLHFALHRGEPGGPGAPETISIRALLAAPLPDRGSADAPGDTEFAILRGEAFRSGESIWSGALYASENARGIEARAGSHGDLRAAITENARRARDAARARADLEALKLQWEDHDPDWAAQRLAPMLDAKPESAVAAYWWAVAVDLAKGDRAAAKQRLESLLEAGERMATWETWLTSAVHMRLGGVASDIGAVDAAREHFTIAARRATSVENREAALAALHTLAL